jgi:hypothetical protein
MPNEKEPKQYRPGARDSRASGRNRELAVTTAEKPVIEVCADCRRGGVPAILTRGRIEPVVRQLCASQEINTFG